MTTNDQEIVQEFLLESFENLERLEDDILALESGSATDAIARVFRSVHTLKGTSSFLGFKQLEALTHAGETVLSLIRDEELVCSAEITSVLLKMVDSVRRILASIETTAGEGDADTSALTAALSRAARGLPVEVAAGPLPGPASPPAPAAGPPPPAVREPEAAAAEVASRGAEAEGRGPSLSDGFVRVSVGVLDRFMDLVGELVLARNQLLQLEALEDTALNAAAQRLNMVTSELQEGVMKTRLQPVGSVWNKVPRQVRDVAMACGKLVNLQLHGGETELDRTILEAIRDPLTHVIRNAIDHGIEAPEERRRLGKPLEGTLQVRAFHEGGQVNLEIVDDGRGVNTERVKERALERGLISREQAGRMSERELSALIFQPGFSTAVEVTNVSGRGVGMDVVKTNIERVGGTVDVESRLGVGTTVKIKIPLTLAIVPALIVNAYGERYAVPQASLIEVVRVDGERGGPTLESILGTQVYWLRGELLPIVHLGRELQLAPPARPSGDVHIVVVKADDRQFGIVVDEVNDTQEIVVKPLGNQLRGISVFAGATILGDGHIALILDVVGVAQRANVLSASRERKTEAVNAAQLAQTDQQVLLLLCARDGGRMAIPLSTVARLEEFPRSAVERAGGRQVVQYRGEIMPLVDVEGVLPEARAVPRHTAPESASLQVVVQQVDGQSVGLVVHGILDVVDAPLKVERRMPRRGVSGTLVVQNRVTEVLDVPALMRLAEGGLS